MDKDKKNDDRYVMRALIQTSESPDYDFEAVAVPVENGQVRYSYINDEYFNQVLRADKESVMTDRLDLGLPLFDNHEWDKSTENTLGITVGYLFDKRGLVIRAKFGARADKELREDIKNGIIRSVSVEGDVIEYSIKRDYGALPVYEASKWMPTSLSFAPVPNDVGATIEVKRSIQAQIERASVKDTKKSFIESLKTNVKL